MGLRILVDQVVVVQMLMITQAIIKVIVEIQQEEQEVKLWCIGIVQPGLKELQEDGAGNPGGMGNETGYGTDVRRKGEDGTGGLLVIYANNVVNTGKMESNGSKGGSLTSGEMGGGSSGGGSINIFYKAGINQNGTIEAKGGDATSNYSSQGGAGSISIGNISTGSYVSTFKNY